MPCGLFLKFRKNVSVSTTNRWGMSVERFRLQHSNILAHMLHRLCYIVRDSLEDSNHHGRERRTVRRVHDVLYDSD